jgi:hypothetical protein
VEPPVGGLQLRKILQEVPWRPKEGLCDRKRVGVGLKPPVGFKSVARVSSRVDRVPKSLRISGKLGLYRKCSSASRIKN